MNLLYFSGSTLPSSYANAVHVMKMCKAFSEEGAKVVLYAKAGKEKRDVFEYYGISRTFDIVRSPNINLPVFSGFLRTAYTLLRKRRADIIYGRDLWTMAAVAGGSVPIVFELHEIPRLGREKELLRRILAAPRLKAIIVITEGLKADLLEFAPGLDAGKILVAADGADMPISAGDSIPLDEMPGTSSQAGYAGSLYPGKGVELILKIAEFAPHIGFHVFGGPSDELDKWRRQNPPGNIKFYGHIPHGQVSLRLLACDALLAPYMPSIHIGTGADISRWISPLKLFEYMALKKPILCSDLPVLREVMRHGENCLMIDPLKPQEWVKALDDLENNQELRKKLAGEAYMDLERKYNWNCRVRKIMDFLHA